jgi:hypothetical protein
MVHGRMIRPAIAGAVPVNVDESSIKDVPGARVVWNQGFLGVVADKEWDAIKAAQQLKVTWSAAAPPFPNQAALYDHIRNAPVRKSEIEGQPVGDVDGAFKDAARVIAAEYEWPFQSHASMGPACAVVELSPGDRAVGCRRAGNPAGCGRDRQCGVQCHRRAHPPRAVFARLCEGGAVLIRHGSDEAGAKLAEENFKGEAQNRLPFLTQCWPPRGRVRVRSAGAPRR